MYYRRHKSSVTRRLTPAAEIGDAAAEISHVGGAYKLVTERITSPKSAASRRAGDAAILRSRSLVTHGVCGGVDFVIIPMVEIFCLVSLIGSVLRRRTIGVDQLHDHGRKTPRWSSLCQCGAFLALRFGLLRGNLHRWQGLK